MKKKDNILYIIIGILTVGIIVLGILMFANKKEKNKKPEENQTGITMDGGELPEGVFQSPSVSLPDDGQAIPLQ